jgi:hypothetical protein
VDSAHRAWPQGILEEAGCKSWPIEKPEPERLRALLTLVADLSAPEPQIRDPGSLAYDLPGLPVRDLEAAAHPAARSLTRDMFVHSYVPIPRSPGLRSLSLNSLLASPLPISAWVLLDPWQAVSLTLVTPFFIVLIGAARGVAGGIEEGLRDRIYEVITGRERRPS